MFKPFKGASILNISTPFSSIHPAIDWYAKYGTPMVSPENATVLGTTGEEFTPDSYDPLRKGYGIKLRGVSGMEWLMWHCQPVFPVSAGELVNAGQIIAFMGNSGLVLSGGKYVPVEERHLEPHFGTHLHLECWNNKERIDPVPLLLEEPDYSYFDNFKAIMIVIGKITRLIAQ